MIILLSSPILYYRVITHLFVVFTFKSSSPDFHLFMSLNFAVEVSWSQTVRHMSDSLQQSTSWTVENYANNEHLWCCKISVVPGALRYITFATKFHEKIFDFSPQISHTENSYYSIAINMIKRYKLGRGLSLVSNFYNLLP